MVGSDVLVTALTKSDFWTSLTAGTPERTTVVGPLVVNAGPGARPPECTVNTGHRTVNVSYVCTANPTTASLAGVTEAPAGTTGCNEAAVEAAIATFKPWGGLVSILTHCPGVWILDLATLRTALNADNAEDPNRRAYLMSPRSKDKRSNLIRSVRALDRPGVPDGNNKTVYHEGWVTAIAGLMAEEGVTRCVFTNCHKGTLTHHCMMAHAPCSSEQFAVNEVAYYNGAVCGTLAGPEKSLGLFWQARLLAYNVVVSSLGNEESTEGVAVPLSAQQHMDVLGGVSIDPSALSVAASLQGFGVVTTVTGAQPRAPTIERSLRNFAAGTSTASMVDKTLRGHPRPGTTDRWPRRPQRCTTPCSC